MDYRNRTEQIIMEGQTPKGGFTHAQLRKWGLDPANLGRWKERLIKADALKDYGGTEASNLSNILPAHETIQSMRDNSEVNLSTPWGRLTKDRIAEPTWEQLENHHGYVYLIENPITGQGYIGIRRIREVQESWRSYMGSSSTLNDFYRTEGKESFQKSLLAFAYSETTLIFLEGLFAVAFSKTGRPCLNGTLGAFRNMVFGAKPEYASMRNKYLKEIRELRKLLTKDELKGLSLSASKAATNKSHKSKTSTPRKKGTGRPSPVRTKRRRST